MDHLTKIYRNGKKALDDLSMTVRGGEIFTLLGPNGAGKSTLINTLTTYLEPTSGLVEVFGHDVRREPGFVRAQVACVAQKNSIDNHLSLMENMRFQSALYHVDRRTAGERIAGLMRTFGLEEYANRRVVTYSGGIKRRLDIAMSMISQPRILFLDEPTVGLDVESRRAVWEIVRKIRDEYGTTVFMTTHYLEEADALSDTICILKDGHELAQDSPEQLRKYTGQSFIRVIPGEPEGVEMVERAFCGLPFVLSIHRVDGAVLAAVKDREEDLRNINRILLDQSISFQEIGIVEPDLEFVFLTLIQSPKQEA